MDYRLDIKNYNNMVVSISFGCLGPIGLMLLYFLTEKAKLGLKFK